MTAQAHLGELVSALLDGELPAVEEAAARAHLAACAACRAELEATSQVRGWVRSLPPVDPPAPANVVPFSSRRRPVAAVASAAAAAAVAAVLLLGQLAPSGREVAPPVGRLVEAHATQGPNSDPVGQVTPVGIPVNLGP